VASEGGCTTSTFDKSTAPRGASDNKQGDEFMTEMREHSYIPKLKEQLVEKKIDRREFLRYSTLLGMSATAAYAFVGRVTGETFVTPAKAAMPKGGTYKYGLRILDVTNPHTYSWYEEQITRQTVEYLTKTDADNVTRPYLCEQWAASDDLRTWTLSLRKDVKWHNGRQFTADDVVWNLQHVLDPATGSSVLGLMKGYIMDDAGENIWDANAIEKVDDHTVKLNLKTAQVAIPEHLFHYPLLMVDPEEGGVFKPGSNGTGPFDFVDYGVGEKAEIRARSDYWGEGPYLDSVRYIDLGDDPSAQIGAIASQQVDGLYGIDVTQIPAMESFPHIDIYETTTANTAVARTRATEEPFTDPRVRKAMRLAIDSDRVLDIVFQGKGLAGEHHHVAPIHPEYADIGTMTRDVEAAKALLAEAGHAEGIDVEIACNNNDPWQVNAVQAMVEQWKDADIRVTINVMPGAAYWDIWDKAPFGMTGWAHRPLGLMVLGLAYRTGVPWNESAYSNPKFDETLTKAEGILDVDERRKVMAELETIMQEDGPIVQPIWRKFFTVHSKKLRGYKPHPTQYIFFNELALEA
jgi:peptide/nickel transport system substrate-binding protein